MGHPPATRGARPVMVVPYGLVARIPGFHPGGSGSIPGMGIFVDM